MNLPLKPMTITLGLGAYNGSSTTMSPFQFDAQLAQGWSGYTSTAERRLNIYRSGDLIGSVPPTKSDRLAGHSRPSHPRESGDPECVVALDSGFRWNDSAAAQFGANGEVVNGIDTGASVLLAGDEGVPPASGSLPVGAQGKKAPPSSGKPISAEYIEVTPRGAIVVKFGDECHVFRPAINSHKDLMGKNVATIVIPDEPMLDIQNGHLRVDQESFFYFLYYIVMKAQGKVPFAVSGEVMKYAERILTHSYQSLEREKLTPEKVIGFYADGEHATGRADLEAEANHWAKTGIEKMRDYLPLGKGEALERGALVIVNRGDMVYTIYEKNGMRELGDLDLKKYPLPPAPRTERSLLSEIEYNRRQRMLIDGEPFLYPSSSGGIFTREGTTGYMVANGGRGIFVDPPFDAIERFERDGLPLDMIEGIKLTHMHIDHIAGALRLASRLPHKRIPIYMSPPVRELFIDTYRALAFDGIEVQDVERLFNFVDVKMLKPYQLPNGFWAISDFSLHSTAAEMFLIYDRHPSDEGAQVILSASGDSLLDPQRVMKLLDEKDERTGRPVIPNVTRAMRLITWPFRGRVRVIDGGVKPLHTGLDTITGIVDGIDAIYGGITAVNHAGRLEVEARGLTYLGEGLKDAISLKPEGLREENTIKSVDQEREIKAAALRRVPVFAELPAGEFDELLRHGKLVVKQGDIAKEGTTGDEMYVIADGELEIFQGENFLLSRTRGLVGETGPIKGIPRTATIRAPRPTWLIQFKGRETKELLQESGVTAKLIKIADGRAEAGAVDGLDPESQDAFLMYYEREDNYREGDAIMLRGDQTRDLFYIVSGRVKIVLPDGSVSYIEEGEFVGEMAALTGDPRSASAFSASEKLVLYRIPGDETERLMEFAPRLRTALLHRMVERRAAAKLNGH